MMQMKSQGESSSQALSSPSPSPVVLKGPRRRNKISFILIVTVFLGVSVLRSRGQASPQDIYHGVVKREAGEVKHNGEGVHHPHHKHENKEHEDGAEPGEGGEHHHLHHSLSTASSASATELPNHERSTRQTETVEGTTGTDHPTTNKTQPAINDTDNQEWNNCITPAIEQFPSTIMSPKFRTNGGFVVHIALAAYTFLALAIICDEFFVPSLEKMCDALKMQPDVAGATFMAAGSSAPELATALIGVFIAKDDIGVSGVIGSAVFNIMFVISICGLLTPTVLYLNWWPMVRDCFFYMVSILALLFCIYDEEIEWYESIVLLLLYGVYCYAMYMNTVLEAWAHTLPIPFPIHAPQVPIPTETSGLVTYKAGAVDPTGIDQVQDTQMDYSSMGEDGRVEGESAKKVNIQPVSILTQFDPPVDSGLKKVLWQVSLPLVYLFYYTVPDCRLERWRTWYVITFSMAMIWIALFSYIMVWMITVVGFTVGIPDTVMGLTFVAAGVSVPDALSSLAVMKEGFGDMAVSNAVGSNVFDILICLGLPWFLSSVVVHPGVSVKVISKGLTYSTLSLLSTVAFLLIATHLNGWQLNKKYGVVLMLWYLFFMILASLYELNVFGDFNPPECSSIF